MKSVARSLFLQIFLITFLSAAAHSEVLDLRAVGEYRNTNQETPEIGEIVAFMTAKYKLLQETRTTLRGQPEVNAVALKPDQIDAMIPVVIDVLMDPAHDQTTGPAVHRVSAIAHLNFSLIAMRLNQLRKDRNAAAELSEVWRQNEVLYQELTQPSTGGEKQKNILITKINVNDLASQVHAALAKTEESPASARVSSVKGKQRALHLAEVAVMIGPELPQAHLAMGDALAASDEPELAEAEYRRGLTIAPGSTTAHIKLAESLRGQGKLTEAVSELREALRLDPKSALAHSDLGFVLGQQQNNEGAVAEYREAIRLDPDLAEAHNNLAIAMARQGRFAEAVTEFQEMVRIDPDSVLGYYNMALALADMEKDAESAEALRQAVRINPNHFNAHFNLGELFRLEGKLDEAVKQFREYVRLAPDTPQNQRNFRRAREFIQTHENP